MADVYDQLLDEQKPMTAPAAPAAPAQSKDAYDTILDEFSAQNDKALKQSLDQALKAVPQQAATTQQLAKASGLPEDVVERNKDTVQQQVKLREIQSLLAASPILSRQMQDPAFAKLAHSDANTLSTIERLWRGTSGGAVEGLGMGTAGIGDVVNIVQRNLSEGFARTFLPTPIGGWDKVDNASLAGPLLGQDWQTVGNYLKQQGRDIQIPQLQQTFFDQVLAGIGQVGSQVTVGALTGPVGSGAFLYGQGANAMTEKVQGDNASQGAKDLAVLSGAGVTAITEKWALDKLLGPMAVPIQNQLGAAFARIGIAGASEGAQETVESLAQDALRQYLTNPDAEIQVGQAFQEGGVGATVGAIVRTVVEAAAGVRGRSMRKEQDAAKAEQSAQMIEQLNKLAAASELLQTSPETFQQFIEAAAEDGDVQDVYIDAQFLMQSGMADQLAQVSPSVAQQLPTALATGGTVQIPVGEYATSIAPTEFAQGLLDHIKTDPQGFSRAEAQEYYQTQAQQLEQEIAQQLETKAGDQEFQASKERVKQTVLTELNNLGRFTPQKNEVDAALIAARTAVRAAQLGMTPEAFFEQQRLKFAAERIDGQVLDQSVLMDLSESVFKPQSEAEKAQGFANRLKNPVTLKDGSRLSGFTDPKEQTTLYGYDKNGELFTIRREQVNPDDIVSSRDSNRTAEKLREGLSRATQFNQAAYHGTPHRFDRFSLDAIGTGEGAQVYGWGLYFAGNKEVAEWYRDSLTNARAQMVDNSRLEVGGQVVDKSSEDYELLLTIERAGGFGPYITDKQMSLLDLQPDHPVYRARVKTIERAKALQEKYGDAQLEYVLDIQMEKADGTLYQVDIPEDNDLLDYSAKFLDQPEKVRQAIAKLFNDIGQFDLLVTNPSGVDIYNFLSEAAAEGRQFEASRTFTDKEEALAFYKEKMAKWRGKEGQMIQPQAEQDFDGNWQVTFGQELDEVFGIQGTMSADRSASLALNKVGIPGLRYQDGMSRGGEGNSYNYVIWDENAVTVEAVNNELAQAEAQAQGQYFQGGTTYVADASQINVDQDLQDLASELLDNGAQITPDGRVRVFHRTSQAAADGIRKTGVMTGKEDGLFFSTKRDGQNVGYGDGVVELHIPLDKLQLDDVFGDEAHVRVPLQRAGQKLNVRQWLGEYNQFAGVRSRTADLGQLEVAKGMAERGLSAAQIQRETGWTKGVDGQWRYEISDDQAKFKENTVDAAAVAAEAQPFIQTQAIGNQYKATYDNGNPMEWLSTFGWTEEEARANVVRKLVERKGGDGFDINKAKVDYPYTLGEVLDHPALFAAYPDLANINIKFTKSDDGSNGVYLERSNRIELEATLNHQEMLSTLLHEIQHTIQAREDFARGGAPERTFTDSVKRAVAQMKESADFKAEAWKRYNWDKLDDAEAAREMASNALKYQSAQRLIDYSNRDKPSGVFRLIRNEMQWIYGEQFYGNRQANDLQRMFYDLPKRGDKRNAFLRKMAWEGAQFLLDSIPAEQRQAFKDDPRTLQSLVKALDRQASKARKELAPLRELEAQARDAATLAEKTQYKTPYDVYRALAGELEARTTQARQKLTAEERRNRSIRLDMDVDPSEAIVIMGGREFRLPSVMRSQAAPTPRGAFNPNNNTIALLKNADLSTFLHEAGHYFFESDIALAAEIAHGNNALGADTMTQGEQEILNDVSALFKWLGINGTIDEQLAQWYSLSFEEKRAYHEKTAESFERYLFEGKAPSIELQSYFQQFRAWLVNVYKSIKDFLTRNPAAGELTDEVRAVFDRMLASTEEIQLAEQARSMMPLFRTQADANNIGMTAEEFRAYQSQDIQATNDAIQDLQARAVRDLQWTRNAHNREVKRLQRQAAELRSEARIDARAEVLSEPVYRAWQFLTRKMQEGDKITPYQRPKSNPDVVDPTIDSLFTAMAKLGGLNKQEAVETWGVEESERPNSGVFGKPVLRATGGKSIDGMVEALAQYGYLPIGTDGKADIADFERKFDEELRGNTQYSLAYDYGMDQADQMLPGEGVNLLALGAGRLDLGALSDMGFTTEEIALLKARKMTAKDGLHPDLVAELPGVEMGSGDELVRKLLEATPLKEEIDARADALMLERHGELATPEAIAREADKAIHNEARAKMVATEANALAKATGERKILAKAAKALAETMIARIKVRDIKPTQYASAEARAAKNAEKAAKSGDLRTAAAEKRSQLVNTYATSAAYKAQDEINAALRYLRKFEKEGSRKGLDVEYLDQIDSLLERFDLRKGQSLKSIDKRETLAKWIAAQEDQGIEPDIPQHILAEANRVHYKNLTVEEFRGLVDSVKQIEHLGRLKKKLLTAKDQRELDAIVDEISTRIAESSGGRTVNNEVRNTVQDKLRAGFDKFMLAHRKAASVARELDGFQDGGPMWEYFTRSMNEAGDYEVTKRAETAQKLHELVKPILAGEKMGGKGRYFQTLDRNLNRGERLAIALNWGNDSNRQRLLGGKGWTAAQVQPVLDTLTAQEWQFVQGVWDLFESFRPEIAAKEKRVSGKEPDWIEAVPLNVTTSDGQQLQLRGGYYPVKYDPRQSGKAGEHATAEEARQMLRAAYTASTTRRSFTKSRVEEVQGRPLLLSFDGIYQGMNEVIHDLAWHEWLIDANKLLRRLDGSIRTNYGADYVDALKKSVKDIAVGDTPAANAVESALSHVRNGSTIVGMGWNLTTALLQPLGYTQSAVRIGGKWMARGLSEFFGSPAHMIAKAEEVQSKSKLMANRALTLNREINDVRNRLESSKSETYQRIESTFFIMIQKMQAMVDYPTWLGAYDKALADPANDEARAVALADQAVLDAQGGGQTKDLAMIQRGGPLLKLFTNFYSYFNVLYNLTTEQTKKRVKAKEYGGLLTDYTMLMIVPAVLSAVLRNVLKGEDDEDKYAKDIAGELLGYPFGMFLGLREMAEAVKLAAGLGNPGIGYSGPAGLRFFSEVNKLGAQVGQGELDWALLKALNNTAGILFHYPAGQVNRLVEGTVELIDGKTDNPLAPLVGVKK